MPIHGWMIHRQDNSLTCQFTDKTFCGHANSWTCQFTDCGQFVQRCFADKQEYSRKSSINNVPVPHDWSHIFLSASVGRIFCINRMIRHLDSAVQFCSTQYSWSHQEVGVGTKKSGTLYTLGRYRRTSSVDAMLTQLEWEPLATRRRTARLVMFCKIHNGLVPIPMMLLLKLYPLPTRAENSQAYHIPISSRDYHLHSFYLRTVRCWNILPEAIFTATSETFKDSISQ